MPDNTTNKFEDISIFPDARVQGKLQEIKDHLYFQTLMKYGFPNLPKTEQDDLIIQCDSVRSFQIKLIYPMLQRLLSETSSGLTHAGLDALDPDTPYLFMSNHRDILLDTSLTNLVLMEQGKLMTASAIGDNLVRDPFLNNLAKLNRNFIVKRGLTPKEALKSSILLSEYIHHLIQVERRSIWIAQKEGRTKDGHDKTNPGVLKMLSLARGDQDPIQFLSNLNIVPVSISYEYDPTDSLKIPELQLKNQGLKYEKKQNEDLKNILAGALGQKNSIHISFGKPIKEEILKIADTGLPKNKQFQSVADIMDQRIYELYKLWPSNYIAMDIISENSDFEQHYNNNDKSFFVERLKSLNIEADTESFELILNMYANPVKNKLNRN